MNLADFADRPLRQAVLAIALLAVLVPAGVQGAPSDPASGRPVSDARLDALRGGYQVNSLTISVGIARVVFVNGEPVVTTTLNIPMLDAQLAGVMRATAARQAVAAKAAPGRTGSGPAPAVPVVIQGKGALSVIQNGGGNTALLQNLPSAGTIIQNTLDNQAIRSITTIDAKVFATGLAQSLNLAASMNDALRRPLAGR